MSHQPSRRVQLDRMEELFKALSSHWRIEILKDISQNPSSQSDLNQLLPIEKSTICRHIKVLNINHLVKMNTKGVLKIISIENPKIMELLAIAEQIIS